MRGDLLNYIPGVEVGGGLYNVWRYTFRIGNVEWRYTTGLGPAPKRFGGFRSRWVWLAVRAGHAEMVVWRRGMRGAP